MGLSLLTYLKEQEDISELLVTDINAGRLSEIVAWLDDKRFTAKSLDANDSNILVETVKGYDTMLNVSAVPNKLPAMKVALAAGAHYIDSGAGPADEQLALDKGFKKRRLLGILHM